MSTPRAANGTPCLRAALEYAGRGWPVSPLHSVRDGHCTCGNSECDSPGKHPLTEHGHKDATTDPATIERWWKRWPFANVGIALEPRSFVALDLDRHDPKADGVAAAETLFDWRPEGPLSVTGGGGLHALYGHPGGPLKSRTGEKAIAPGLELKATGLIVAPPSLHVSGRRYAWKVGPGEALPQLPAWALNGDSGGDAAYQCAERKAIQEEGQEAESTLVQGGRNDGLTRLAGAMRRRGATEAEMLAALTTANRDRCRPPLPDPEVAGIAKSVAHYAPRTGGENALGFPLTDAGNGELVAALCRDRLRYDATRGRWLHWPEGAHRWHADGDAPAMAFALDAARRRYRAAEHLEPAQRKPHVRWAMASESRGRLEAAAWVAARLPGVRDDGLWDDDPWLLGVKNGVVDLRSGELRAGLPGDRLTMTTGFPFDAQADCPRWRRFLEEVFCGEAALIDFAWRAVGYSLTGDTSAQCLFVGYGKGANGKSTFLTVLRRIAGEYAHDTPFTTFELAARASIPCDLAALAGRRLVTASETTESARLNEARVKAITGQDPVTARFMRENFFTFTPVCKVWLAVNHKPRVGDDTLAFWRRVRLIPFRATFEGGAADPRLMDALRSEAPGILAWAVKGCLEWQRRGLDPPRSVTEATREYREESDPLAPFLEARCVVAAGCHALSGELYGAYKEWAKTEGVRDRDVLTHTAFGTRLTARFGKKPTNRGTEYQGVGVRASEG